MIKRVLGFVLLQIFLLLPAAAADGQAQQIVASIKTPRDQRVPFTELRMSPLLAEPLQLSGTVEFTTAGELSKRIDAPFDESVSISSRAVVLERDGKRRKVSMRRNSNLWEFYSGLRAMLAGDADAVARYYEIEVIAGADSASNSGQAWEVRLIPKSEQLAAFIESMTVKGTMGRVLYVRTQQAPDNWQEVRFIRPVAAMPDEIAQ